ncbi:MAG: DegT/DnrJ/EryC1/StrS family aminotransferase [Bacteroidales bacterium]
MAAIARYGMRMVPESAQIIRECRQRRQLVQGPHVAAFEQEFQRVLGQGHVRAVSTEYGRMALYYILKSMDFTPGSEIIVPALTFWVVPEICRAAGLKVVFADIDPSTFTLSPAAVERAITPSTRAVLPTHLYGLPCDLDPIVALARRHGLKVVEDCAHSLGSTYNGQMVGTFGDASFFSFQAFKPLNTFGGGLAWMRDAELARRVGELADAEAWPTEKKVEGILRAGWFQRTFIRPTVFTYSGFPIWWIASYLNFKPDVYLWEDVRSLAPIPDKYRGKFSNVQAAIGRAGLAHLQEFIDRTRRHAAILDSMLGDLPGVTIPSIPAPRTHVYYQYCAYVPDYQDLIKRCIRRGVDVAPMHVDVCTRMPLFGWQGPPAEGAEKAATAVQIPVYESLQDYEIERIGRTVREEVLKQSAKRPVPGSRPPQFT